MGAPPTPTLAPTVYSIALCPDYAPGCGSGNAPSASVGDTCTTECKEHGNAWFCFVGNSDVKWGWCAQQQVCTAIDSIATDAWCMSSCNHIPSHCPASHCKCTATTAAPPTAAPSTAVPAPTPPSPNCLSWCAVNAKPWSEKCAWSASCNECDDCATSAPPTPAPPCIAISSTATDAWCTSTCNHIPPNCPASHCQCTATTAAPPTAAPSVPTPTPPSPNCLSWCAVNAKPWSEKCAWGASCNECDDCTKPAPPTPAPPAESNPNCKSWCAKDTRPWTQKCKWTSTCACSDCP